MPASIKAHERTKNLIKEEYKKIKEIQKKIKQNPVREKGDFSKEENWVLSCSPELRSFIDEKVILHPTIG